MGDSCRKKGGKKRREKGSVGGGRERERKSSRERERERKREKEGEGEREGDVLLFRFSASLWKELECGEPPDTKPAS